MAKSKGAQVTLHGRFRPGAVVRLVKVQNEGVLRAEGGEEVATETVDADGRVQFTDGVEEGARYFIVGQVDGTPLEVRCRGNAADDDNHLLALSPVQPDPQKLADGTLAADVVLPGTPRQVADKPAAEEPKPAAKRARRAPAKQAAGSKPAAKKAAAKPSGSKPAASRSASTKAKQSSRGSARKG